jgi:hypothetical protein
MYPVLKKEGVVVFLFPALTTTAGLAPMPQTAIDAITQIGYRLVQLSGSGRGLLYKRPDALVGRELLIFQKVVGSRV